MPLFHLAILALIQGITEFLPVSSSGHLALYPILTGEEDQGQTIDVAVHVGTLFAVLIYFRHDVLRVIEGLFSLIRLNHQTDEARLAILLILSTIPVVIAGAVLSLSGLDDQLRSIAVIGWSTIIFGVALFIGDRFGGQTKTADDWTLKDAIAMGLAQIVALIPGASRSGVTMTMARGIGYKRVDAARLSMLMSIPTIIAAGALTSLKLVSSGDLALGLDAALAAALAFFAALAALTVMMRMLQTWSMTPFVIYRMILGAILLWIAYASRSFWMQIVSKTV